MRVDLQNIGLQGFQKKFVISSDTSERLSDFFKISNERILCRVEILKVSEKFILCGQLKGLLSKPCDYCLEETEYEICSTFEYFLVQSNFAGDTGKEREILPEDANTELIADYDLNVLPYFEDNIFLEFPTVFLCKEDCKGLCSVCGQNLNLAVCDCRRKETRRANPFSVLKSKII